MRIHPSVKWLLMCLALCSQVASAAIASKPDPHLFGVLYTVWIKPEEQSALVKIRFSKNPEFVEWIQLHIDPSRQSRFSGTGKITVTKDKVLWKPPAKDAWLQYHVKLNSKRQNGQYDGLITPEWALFRADDLVPPLSTSLDPPYHSRAKLQLNLPDGWSVRTRYPRYSSGRFKIEDPNRLLDRPTGWLVMGKISARLERIGHTQVTVASPPGQDPRPLDLIAFFRWTLPVMQEIFPRFPERLLVVRAGDPMWRGALSAPDSLYVHSDRPILSQNGTSTIIHELVHVAMHARSGPKADWIVEGLAEYYSLEVLRRTGTISEQRFEKAHGKLAAWGKDVKDLEVARSSGPITAKAVGVMRELDKQIRAKSGGARSLDDVVRGLAAYDGPVTREHFDALVKEASRPGPVALEKTKK